MQHQPALAVHTASDSEWWKSAVIYQIYPRSFQDSNGDGVGDLRGITHRLDYVASLGVDAIWLSPFFTSPMKDFGYDVADYRGIDPLFGTMEDFDAMLAKAHSLGLKIIIDQVMSHCSDAHQWFVESRQSRDNPKADWFVWADPKPDGTPPNNWLSVFGGPAWTWDTSRRQYYFHNFLSSQPDLDLNKKHVQDALLAESAFWLDKGVDGFRLDAIVHAFCDPQLRDNPPAPLRHIGGVVAENPYALQEHLYDRDQPGVRDFLVRVRQLLDSYPDRMMVCEVSGEHELQMSAEFTRGGDAAHTAYSFALLQGKADAATIRQTLETFQLHSGDDSGHEGWPAWAFSNHDVVRTATRWAQGNPEHAKTALALLASLRGTIFLYQGEELGLTEAEVPFELLQDPYGKAFWPKFKGRDGCRTPMVWDSILPNAGFSQQTPWLPVAPEHAAVAVAQQQNDPASMLNFTRNFIAWRKHQPALLLGTLAFKSTESPDLLAFERTTDTQKLLCAFNLGDTATPFDPGSAKLLRQFGDGLKDGLLQPGSGLIAQF